MSTAPPIEPSPTEPSARRGCWKGALFGCGGSAILVVACLVGLGIYVQKRPAAVTDMLMDRIRDRFAADVTAQDKADLDAAYAEFREALEARRVSSEDLDRVRVTVKLGREVGRAEVHELTRVFREATEASVPQPGTGEEPPETTPLPVAVTPIP